MSLRVEIKGMDKLVRNLSRFSDAALKGIVTASEMSQAMIVNDARSDHPYTDRTGNLTNSIQPGEIIVTDKDVTAYVEARMQYATFVEFGTSRAVAYPFLTPAMLRQASNFRKNVARALQEVRL